MNSLSAADTIRLNTWAIDIAIALLPAGAERRIDGTDTRFAETGGLCINTKSGAWYIHSLNKGGWGTAGLIQHLRQCSYADAITWAIGWLGAHPGIGSCDTIGDYEDEAGAAALASAAYAEELLTAAVEIEGTVGEDYLRSRALLPPYPDCVKFVPDVRTGEHGLLGILIARGRVVGVQLGYLTPAGTKTLLLPARRIFLIDHEAGREGIFDLQLPISAVQSPRTFPGRILVEGLENALALRTVKDAWLVHGMPGIGRLKHMKVRPTESLLFFRDGDPPESAAQQALVAGVDSLLLQGAVVSVTATPAGEDANTILQQENGSAQLLKLIEQATLAELSLRGEIVRLSRLDVVEYDQERLPIAKKLRIRAATLDDLAGTARLKPPQSDTVHIEVDPPWEGEVNLRDILDAALIEIQRYVIARDIHLGTIIIWAALSHITHNEHVRLQKSPRLALQSRMPGSGKTTCMEVVGSLSLRGTMASSYSASALLRSMDADKPTLLLDEADGINWESNSELGSILKAGDRRRSAIAKRSVPTPDGGWEVRDFCVWGAVAIAGINELPQPLQDRSLCIWLERALGGEALDHLRDGSSPRLVELRRQLKAWGERLPELPEPELPAVLRRQPARLSDNWRPIMAIAQLAGGQWPALISQAIEAAITEEQRPNTVMRLLRSIHRAFNLQAEQDTAAIELAATTEIASKAYYVDRADNALRLTTPTLLRYLLTEEEEEWNTANRGRSITPYYLRHQLRHLLKPKSAMDWWTGPAENRKHHSGYTKAQFKAAWTTILPGETGEGEDTFFPQGPSPASGASGSEGAAAAQELRPGESDQKHASDDCAPAEGSAGSDNGGRQPSVPHEPDAPDQQQRVHGKGRASHLAASTKVDGDGKRDRDLGSDVPPKGRRSPSTAVQVIRDLRTEHPEWSTARLARSLGTSDARVIRALHGWEPPPPGSEAL